MKIACWSGPRNISTALMRSWSSRNDTAVIDEPFYAYYLRKKKLKHPMYKQIINRYPHRYNDVLKSINKENPNLKKIWYQKHMAHHIVDLENIQWITNFKNCFLIRDPKYVISSYIKKNELNNVEELGYPQQLSLLQYLLKKNTNFIVIDSKDLLKNPQKLLKIWCSHLKIEFQDRMLSWEKGKHFSDGIWAEHWYGNIINSNKFHAFKDKNISLSNDYKLIYDNAMHYYDKLNEFIDY